MAKKEAKVENLNDKKVVVDSFKKYDSAEDGITKKIDGETNLEDFHLYESGDE